MISYPQKAHRLWQKVIRKVNATLDSKPEKLFPLQPELPLPEGVSEEELFNFLKSVLVADAPPQEMANYCQQDFRRFVYTYGLVKDFSGKCLELGANPYFTTILLQEFTQLDLSLANYFGSHIDRLVVQEVNYKDYRAGKKVSIKLESSHFNIEEENFPFKDAEFDVVLFCEIIEHLLMNPVAVLKEIKRILKPNGALILTTPNVSRLENVTKMISGTNIYDPYSGYGPYGRHNREYNQHELYLLLDYMGFSLDAMFTADVHPNQASHYSSVSKLAPLLRHRELGLGQYIFMRALNTGKAGAKKPAFLYRSYPADELDS
jgi:SAM-dependent methyltransferase